MAATILKAPGHDQIHGGQLNALITAAETNQLTTGPTRMVILAIWTAATAAVTVDIYDHASANTNNVWREVVGASAGVVRELQLPMANGLRVVTSGVAGTFGVNVSYT